LVDGTGNNPVFSVSSTSVSYANVLKNTSKIDSVVVSNPNGQAPLRITSVTSGYTEFTVSPTSDTIQINGSRVFRITFSPTSVGAKSGNIVFSYNLGTSPTKVSVSGTGTAPSLSSSTTSLSFGDVLVGNNKQDSVTITNSGTSDLHISSASTNNTQFSVSPVTGTIIPNGTKKFYLTFSPNALGAQSGNLTFLHDGETSPTNISVSGSGVTPGFALSTSLMGKLLRQIFLFQEAA